MKDIYGRVREF